MPVKAIIALNYQGIGLPPYLYNQTLSMIARMNLSPHNFTCDNFTCTLDLVCSQYPGFVDALAFKIKFKDSQNYVIMPLAAFATENSETCTLHIQKLATDNTIYLGALFAQ
jgi:hypothetical protein